MPTTIHKLIADLNVTLIHSINAPKGCNVEITRYKDGMNKDRADKLIVHYSTGTKHVMVADSKCKLLQSDASVWEVVTQEAPAKQEINKDIVDAVVNGITITQAPITVEEFKEKLDKGATEVLAAAVKDMPTPYKPATASKK